MIVTYNGINLQVEHIRVFEEKAIYAEGGDYLYTHFRIGVQCVWNPFATKVTGGAPVDPQDASFGPYGVRFLRHSLLQPRKQLTIRFNNNYVLNSPTRQMEPADNQAPTPDYPCDVNNGPIPLCVNVEEFHGFKTCIVYFEIETWLNECVVTSLNNGFPSVLSHRWTMTQDIDENYLTTRTIQGSVIFRADRLAANFNDSRSPDQYRAYFIHETPPQYKRIFHRTSLSADNTVLSYVIVDEEQPYVIFDQDSFSQSQTGARITSIRGEYVDVWDGAGGIVGLVANELPRIARNTDFGSADLGPFGRIDFNVVAQGLGRIAQGIAPFFSSRSVQIYVEATGNRMCHKGDLMAACIRVATNFGFTITQRFSSPAFTNVQKGISIHQKRAWIAATLTAPGVITAYSSFTAGDALAPLNNDNISWEAGLNLPNFQGTDSSGNINMNAGSFGTMRDQVDRYRVNRTTIFPFLMAQRLNEECTIPYLVPDKSHAGKNFGVGDGTSQAEYIGSAPEE